MLDVIINIRLFTMTLNVASRLVMWSQSQTDSSACILLTAREGWFRHVTLQRVLLRNVCPRIFFMVIQDSFVENGLPWPT